MHTHIFFSFLHNIHPQFVNSPFAFTLYKENDSILQHHRLKKTFLCIALGFSNSRAQSLVPLSLYINKRESYQPNNALECIRLSHRTPRFAWSFPETTYDLYSPSRKTTTKLPRVYLPQTTFAFNSPREQGKV